MIATPTDENEQRVFDDIARYGLHIVHVLSDGGRCGFSYTIGLWAKSRAPEVIVIGLKRDISQFILNEINRRARKGERLGPGVPHGGLIDRFDCYLFEVDRHHYSEYVGWARWFYEGDDFPLLQCVYPTTAGVFPWEEKAPESFRAYQPILSAKMTPPGRA